MNKACSEVGFFIVTGHGIEKSIIDSAWKSARDFFDLPVEDKSTVPMTSDYAYGYSGFGDEVLVKGLDKNKEDDGRVEKATVQDLSAPDLKESFQICIGPKENPSKEMKTPLWPEKPVEMKENFTNYYRELEKLSSTLLKGMATGLKLPFDWFEKKIDQHLSVLRALNYPHMDQPPKPGQMRAGAHTDYGSLTILLADDAPGGLQLFLNEEWIPVKAPSNSFIINLGDLMQRWTNDKWVSTLHRVVPPPPDSNGSTRRQSMAFFHNINPDTLVECIDTCKDENNPPKYPPIDRKSVV